MTELEALVILTMTPYLGSIKIRHLLKRFGSALKALQASSDEVSQILGLEPKMTNSWGDWKKDRKWEENLEMAARSKVELVPFTSSNYPQCLLILKDPPLLLYVKGEVKRCDLNGLAVIGTRNPSLYGRTLAERISRELAEKGVTVVSGLARGIDTAAHSGALNKGRTLAVLGSGLTTIYPSENVELADRISANGALISEYSMCTPPDRLHFLQRNRIVGCLGIGTVLVEAPLKSGSMQTMELSFEYNKKLFSFPGPADCENFQGNHFLIKKGKAKLVENIEDILKNFETLFDVEETKELIKK